MREKKGLSLATIAERTKIRASLFASFEQNDLRAWPQGLYRRAYFREYARLFDDRIDESCEEFNKLFTDEPEPPAAPADAKGAASSTAQAPRTPRNLETDLRLVFDAKWHGPRRPLLMRLVAVVADIVLIAMITGVMKLTSGFDSVVIIAAATLAYFSLSTILFSESAASWMMAHRDAIIAVFKSEDDGVAAEQPAGSHEERPWISDATRVGPSPPPQLRVRFKA